jgi:hypothetical protein
MGVYRRFVLPRLIHLACRVPPVMRQRAEVVPAARGRVLEVGVGSGLNLQLYDSEKVEHVIGIDPAPEMLRMAERSAREARVEVELVPAGAEEIPFADRTFDTVLVTYALCTIPDPVRAARDGARARVRRLAPVLRARSRARRECPALAAAGEPAVATRGRWLQPREAEPR